MNPQDNASQPNQLTEEETMENALASMIEVTRAQKPPQSRFSTTNKERYYHLRDLKGQGKFSDMTVFARQNAMGYWHMSVAFCAIGDQFSRRIGRQVARRRFFHSDKTYGVAQDICTFERVKDVAYKALLDALAESKS